MRFSCGHIFTATVVDSHPALEIICRIYFLSPHATSYKFERLRSQTLEIGAEALGVKKPVMGFHPYPYKPFHPLNLLPTNVSLH